MIINIPFQCIHFYLFLVFRTKKGVKSVIARRDTKGPNYPLHRQRQSVRVHHGSSSPRRPSPRYTFPRRPYCPQIQKNKNNDHNIQTVQCTEKQTAKTKGGRPQSRRPRTPSRHRLKTNAYGPFLKCSYMVPPIRSEYGPTDQIQIGFDQKQKTQKSTTLQTAPSPLLFLSFSFCFGSI